MGIRKRKDAKNRQILIRVNREEADIAKKIAKENGISVSELLRRLMRESDKRKSKNGIHKIIIKKYEEILEKFRRLYSEYN